MASISEYRQAIAGAVSGLVLALAGMGSYIGSDSFSERVRPDPATGSDLRELGRDLRFEMRVLEHDITSTMPPPGTRKRIKAIEHCLEHGCTDFRSPTTDW